MINNKRAITHVENIISFSIFIIFLIALFIYLPPVQKPNISDVLLDSLQHGIENETNINLLEIPIILNMSGYSASISCFTFANPITSSNSDNIVVKNNQSVVVPFSISSSNLNVANNGAVYYFYYSNQVNFKNINQAPLTLSPCTAIQYFFSAPRIYSIYSYANLSSSINSVSSNYANAKLKYKIPASADFMIQARNEYGIFFSTESAKKPAVGISVKARDIPIEYLENGDIKKGILNIRVW
ncbi:hypothetical protein COS75_02665 [Candidatus Pacearchaeota archaeon CG06_land_8_20_14_3_00_35_12]|nr:MAG: hypothetical protein COS75_02665 [Candidatus Pacearchaeota archaeon CG06_land_8_20_14_3_00_35_12]